MSSTSLQDLTEPGLPNIAYVLGNGSIGLMNARTAGTPKGKLSSTGFESACLSIGAGARTVGAEAVSGAFGRDFMLSDQSAAQLWSSRTLKPAPSSGIVQPSVARIVKENSGLKYDVALGTLGQRLHESGLKTAVIGNSDTCQEFHREAVAIAMDGSGLVDFGAVDRELNVSDPAAPFGLAADHSAYMREVDRIWSKADLIVVDPGDTLRAALYSNSCVKPQALRMRKWAIRRADRLLGDVLQRVRGGQDLLIVISPNLPGDASEDGLFLRPIFVLGSGFGEGILSSASTRWTGVITNLDIAPTLLSFFGIKNAESMIGRSLSYVPLGGDKLSGLTKTEHRIALRGKRQPISRWIATVNALIILVATLGLIFLRRRRRILSLLILLPASLVLSSLLFPLSGAYDLVMSAIGVFGLGLLIAFAALKLAKNVFRSLALVCILLCVGLVGDLIFRFGLLRESVLSYSASEGARYYGVGNEFMGALIGATLIGIGMLFTEWKIDKRIRQIFAAIAMGAVAFCISAPFLGANTGGAMSVVPAVLVALILRSGTKIRIAHILGLFLSIVGVVGLLILCDTRLGSGQSHIGRFGASLVSGGFGEFWLVIRRKLEMNFMLLESSLWSRLMMVGALSICLLWRSRILSVSVAMREYPEIFAAVVASLVGAVFAFAFNDSGVVAAALLLIYPWSAVALLALARLDCKT